MAKKSPPKPVPAKKEKPAPKATPAKGSGSPSPSSKSPSRPSAESSRKPVAPAPKVLVVSADDKEKALRLPSLIASIHARKAAAVSRRKNAVDERNNFHGQIEELGLEAREPKHKKHDDYLQLRKRHGEALDEIDSLAETIKGCDAAYDRVALECSEGRLAFAEMTVDEFVESASEPAAGTGQMTLDQAAGPPGPSASWRKIMAFKDFFAGKAEKDVRLHFGKIEALSVGMIPADNPVQFGAFIDYEFRRLGDALRPQDVTEGRANILPKFPDWFSIGLWALMGAAAAGELGDKQDEAHTTDADTLCNRLNSAVERDAEAWVKLVGRDSPINKTINVPANA